MVSSKRILPIIVFCQFCCTSLWFAGNSVIADLVDVFQLEEGALSYLTSSVQFGFILGTLVFAIFTISDRFSPSKIFFLCGIIGSAFNLSMIVETNSINSLLVLRFLTGFSLAGIYPVGMKIAADHFGKNLGKSLGYLVGALVLGTSFPHLVKSFTSLFPWKQVLIFTSITSLVGAFLILLIPDGPNRTISQKLDLKALIHIFRKKDFRSAAFGYFGHMWELYAFWVFVPVMLSSYAKVNPTTHFDIPLLSFIIIGSGSLSCVLAGYISQKIGVKKTVVSILSISACCCLLFPLVFFYASPILYVAFLLFWGLVVIADSPLFSTLVAQNAYQESKGTALTIVNCIGFSITIISIQLLGMLEIGWQYMILVIGPLLGLRALKKV